MERMVTRRSQNAPIWPHQGITGWRNLSPLEQAQTSDQQVIEALVRWHWRLLTRPGLSGLAEAYDLTDALATVRREAGA
jgi:hypothetical protein